MSWSSTPPSAGCTAGVHAAEATVRSAPLFRPKEIRRPPSSQTKQAQAGKALMGSVWPESHPTNEETVLWSQSEQLSFHRQQLHTPLLQEVMLWHGQNNSERAKSVPFQHMQVPPWPPHLHVMATAPADCFHQHRHRCRRRGSRTGSPTLAGAQAPGTQQIPLSHYSWRQCPLIVLPSIQNYYNTHFIGLSQGLFNISEELWRRNSGYCSQYHRIGNYLTWILHDCACVTVAAPVDYFFFTKKKIKIKSTSQ